MPGIEKRTISLPAEQAEYLDRLVASGGYASVSEVVRAGLRALQAQDAVVERWLREQVVPVYDAMQADPSRAINAEEVEAHLIARRDALLKQQSERAQEPRDLGVQG